MGKHDHNPFMLGDMVVTPTFYGDGGYPVIAEIEGGRPKKITIDFDPSGDEDYDEMEFIINTPNIEEIRAKHKRENTK